MLIVLYQIYYQVKIKIKIKKTIYKDLLIFINNLENVLNIKNCKFYNINISSSFIEVSYSNIEIHNSSFQKIYSSTNYLIQLFNTICVFNNIKSENTSSGFAISQENSYLEIIDSFFKENYVESLMKSFLNIFSPLKIYNSTFVNIANGFNGSVKKIKKKITKL